MSLLPQSESFMSEILFHFVGGSEWAMGGVKTNLSPRDMTENNGELLL